MNTLVWPLTDVGAKVSCQITTRFEALAAMITLARHPTRVDTDVTSQVTLCFEALVAMAAPKGAPSGVYPLVNLEAPWRSCCIATFGAQILLSSCL